MPKKHDHNNYLSDRYRTNKALAAGVFHFSNQGEASWADIAKAVMLSAKALGGVHAEIERISTSEYPTKARRPRNSQLNSEKIRKTYGIVARNWHDAVFEIVTKLGGRVER